MGGPAEGRLDHLRKLLDSELRVPFAEYRWQSRRARTFWHDLEGMLDAMAGPLTSIADKGQCDYVYRDQERWPNVDTPTHLCLWLEGWLQKVRGSVHGFRPTSSQQVRDLDYMLEVIANLEEAVKLAVHLEKQRFSEAQGGGS